MINTSPTLRRLLQHHKRLCPCCGGITLHIVSSAEIRYEVAFDSSNHELVVLGQYITDGDWDHVSKVQCPSCHWQGQLADCIHD